jgi:hypothetical protein
MSAIKELMEVLDAAKAVPMIRADQYRDEFLALTAERDALKAKCLGLAEQSAERGNKLIEAREENGRLRTALCETREALEFVIGDHNIPGDCYSTGPVTGTPLDAVCPSCSGIRVLARHAALAGEEVARG